jgi:hypothetical protein
MAYEAELIESKSVENDIAIRDKESRIVVISFGSSETELPRPVSILTQGANLQVVYD